MSPRAAWRLEALGLADVYDYVLGKADWLAHNLPVDGANADQATAGRAARDDVVTCRPDDRVGAVRERIERSPYGFALVTSPAGVVLGRLRASRLGESAAESVESVMEPGPSTVRPDLPAATLARRLAERNLRAAIVTTPEGQLIGIARREDLERDG
jgi:CBS domain-containing protein